MAFGADTQTDRHTHTHIPTRKPKQFQETRHTPACSRYMPGLKIHFSSICSSVATTLLMLNLGIKNCHKSFQQFL